jgi:replicative DNA helicase
MVTSLLKLPEKPAIESFDLAAENATLSSLILAPDKAAPILAQTLSFGDYYDQGIAKVVFATLELHQAGEPVADPIYLLNAWKKLGLTDAVVSMAGIARLIDNSASVAHIQYHADIVKELGRKRKLARIVADMGQKAISSKSSCEDLLTWLDSQVLTIRHGSARAARLAHEVMDDVIDQLAAQSAKKQRSVLLSGLPAADERGFVFGPGELVVLAARPGVGKTTLATQIALHHASHNRTVLMASLEMKDKELVSRLLVSAAGYNHQDIRTGIIDQTCIDDLRRAKEEFGEPPFVVWSPGRVKAGVIHATAALTKATRGLELLIVDYIGYVTPDDKNQKRNEQIGIITKALRDIGQQLQIPVLALAQSTRSQDKERPTLSSLGESADIERDADIVAFLHAEKEGSVDVELIIAKNRQGSKGTVPLKFDAVGTRFIDPSVDVRLNKNYEPAFSQW